MNVMRLTFHAFVHSHACAKASFVETFFILDIRLVLLQVELLRVPIVDRVMVICMAALGLAFYIRVISMSMLPSSHVLLSNCVLTGHFAGHLAASHFFTFLKP